ncbi:unnamed protein product [Closterium sp. NIES-53]
MSRAGNVSLLGADGGNGLVHNKQRHEILSEDRVVLNYILGNPFVFGGRAVFPADQKFDPAGSPWVTYSVAQYFFGRDDWLCQWSSHAGGAGARQLAGRWDIWVKQADVERPADVPVSREEEVGGDGGDHVADAKWPAVSGAEFWSDGFRQKLLVNFVSRSLMIAAGIPCNRATVVMKRRAVSSAVIDILQGAKCAIFVSRLTTTRIASFPLAPAAWSHPSSSSVSPPSDTDTPAWGTVAVPAVPGVATRPRPYFVPLLQQVLGPPPPPPLESPPAVQSQPQPASPLPAPSPYAGPTGGLTERREPASRPASPVRTKRASGRGSRQLPPPVPGTHRMSLRPSTAPLRAPLPSPPTSSLPALADPESDSLRAASPPVARLLATAVTDPSFESSAASALVTELVDFAARCRLDYAARLVAESESSCSPSVGGECALGTNVLEDRQEEFQCLAAASPHLASVLLAPEGDPDALDIPTPRSYAEAIEGPYSSQWQAAMDAEMASWKSTGTYVDAVPPPGANIVSGMWIFRLFFALLDWSCDPLFSPTLPMGVCQNIIACQFV